MPNTTGLTSPHRHTKPPAHGLATQLVDVAAAMLLPIFEWADDATTWERTYVAIRTALLALLAVVVIVALAACKPVEPGIDSTTTVPSVVEIVPGPPPVPTATSAVNG
jgi:hypothetical protein